MLIIPFIPSVGDYSFETTIGNTPFLFEVRWNERDQAWYFDLLETDGAVVARGLKIVLGAYIGRTCMHELFTAGIFAAIDTSGEYREATFDDLGTRVEVRFYSEADIIIEVYR